MSESIPLELTDAQFLALSKEAHESGTTLNSLISNLVIARAFDLVDSERKAAVSLLEAVQGELDSVVAENEAKDLRISELIDQVDEARQELMNSQAEARDSEYGLGPIFLSDYAAWMIDQYFDKPAASEYQPASNLDLFIQKIEAGTARYKEMHY